MIFITGDCHGEPERFLPEHFPQQEKMGRDDYLIVAGDFGFIWDGSKEDEKWLDWLEERSFTTLWVDGNHENFDLLKKYPVRSWKGGNVHFVRPHVIHLMRGQMYTLQGHTFFTFGGARSIDRILRVSHLSWWEEELPSEEELRRGWEVMERAGCQCDFIVTHCAPTGIKARLFPGEEDRDILTDYLEKIRRLVKYGRWFCGHYHLDQEPAENFEVLYTGIRRIV